jgi:3-oxoacyl-[acyl-carrier protein] reductase
MMELTGRIALVTGAAKGIGAEITNGLLKKGAKVILTDINLENLISKTNEFREEGYDVDSKLLDVREEQQVIEAFKWIDEKYGRLDILVNNAGLSPKVNGIRRNTQAIPTSEWDTVLDINLKGTFLCTREALPLMQKGKWGRVISIASQAGRTGSRVSGTHYSASKAGIIGFMRTLATEYGTFGITANSIAPGPIETDLLYNNDSGKIATYIKNIPVGRLGKAQEVASAVTYLCSVDAGFINGATIDVNGGLFMS